LSRSRCRICLRMLEAGRVRHDLPRAPLLLLAALGARRSSARGGLARVRRSRSSPPTAVASRLWASLDARSGDRRGRARPRSRACRGARLARRLRVVLRRGFERLLEELRAFLREGARREAGGSPATQAAAKGKHAPQLCRRHPRTRASTSSTGARTSRGCSCRAPISRSSTRSTSAANGPTTCCCSPGNLRDEIVEQMAYVREWGCRFVVPVPRLEVFE